MKLIKDIRFLILGAGPSGLTLAHSLLARGIQESEILVLEKENEAGGLCRSKMVDGHPLDIGGGHFLDVKNKNVLDFLFQFMPRNEWNEFSRVSKINLHGSEIDYPLESNIWQLKPNAQVEFLESIARAGSVTGKPEPVTFEDWIRWKLGDSISDQYMIPYNKKIWSINLNCLGAYWLYKLPSVSLRDTLMSCIQRQSYGSVAAHGKFLYPKKFGYGELWHRMAIGLGKSLILGHPVERINLETMTVNNSWRAGTIINTIPWTLWCSFTRLPHDVASAISKLRYASVDIEYHPNTYKSDAHWIYDPDESLSHHRLLLRSNFIQGARGHWSETNVSRSKPLLDGQIRFNNEFSYPINTVEKFQQLKIINDWAKINSIIGLGRWGRWEHMNSDVAVDEAIKLADHLMRGGN